MNNSGSFEFNIIDYSILYYYHYSKKVLIHLKCPYQARSYHVKLHMRTILHGSCLLSHSRCTGKSVIWAGRVSLRNLRFQKERGKRRSPLPPRLFDMTSERQRGKEMAMLVNKRDGVSGETTGRWRETCALTHKLPTPIFLPFYILIREELCPELSHIVRNFLSE